MKPFLLLGTRDEDTAADHPYDAFLGFTGLDESSLHRVRLERRPLGPVDLDDWSGIFLRGGPFNSSDPAGAKSPVPQDIWAELWSQMLFVVPFGSLGAALDATIGELRTEPSSRLLLEAAMREVEALARARGIRLPDRVVAGTLAYVDDQPVDGTTTLQRDLLEDRPSELDAWTGAVVRLAGKSGVDVPLHQIGRAHV